MTSTLPRRISAHDLADQLADQRVRVIDVREPMEYAAGHIAGSLNVPLARISEADLPGGPLVLVCHSGNRSSQALSRLLQHGHPHPLADLEGGIPAWQEAGLPVRKLNNAPLPLMRQVQIAAGSLVLLGLVFAGVSGFCGMARLLAVMPWNRVRI
jgi:rhodanese-related sulfurtransferase